MYEDEKNNPEFAAQMIAMMLSAHLLLEGSETPDPMSVERLQKCKHLFKTLCLAAQIREGLIESFWVAAFHPSLETLDK